MQVHFIAIGGAAMHNLAIALHKKGYIVSGSDDEIFEPSYSRLAQCNLLPKEMGWYPERIHSQLDAVILGMHARADNPELIKAQELGLKIYSFPEYLYEQSKTKKRVVIGGSHGKTTITAMILHVLKNCGLDADYLVGAKLEGFDVMVKITEKAPIMVFEGDEYLTSPIDRRPKFHLYKPDIALLSGIAWDHINVFPTFEMYVEQFRIFANMIPAGGSLVYYSHDSELQKIANNLPKTIKSIPYKEPEFEIHNGITYVLANEKKIPLLVFGKHNLSNIEGAKNICMELGVNETDFYNSIRSFSGASNRLELLGKNQSSAIYKDFAHSPSKLKATIQAVKEQYPSRRLIACMELHTYSSLNHNFLDQYRDTMQKADEALVYFNPHTIELKKLPEISKEQVYEAFNKPGLKVFTSSNDVKEFLLAQNWSESNLLMMSSGNFDNLDFKQLTEHIINS